MTLAALLLVLSVGAQADHTRTLFSAHGCAACHRVDGRGGNSGPDLSFVGFRRSAKWLERWLSSPRAWKPDTKMPEPALGARERAELVDYLSSLTGPAPRVPSGAPAARGKALFKTLGCVACHGPAGRGGHPNNNVPGGRIPALPALVSTYTKDELKARIKNGIRPEKEDPRGDEPLVAMPAWGELLKDEDLDALTDYLMTLATNAETGW